MLFFSRQPTRKLFFLEICMRRVSHSYSIKKTLLLPSVHYTRRRFWQALNAKNPFACRLKAVQKRPIYDDAESKRVAKMSLQYFFRDCAIGRYARQYMYARRVIVCMGEKRSKISLLQYPILLLLPFFPRRERIKSILKRAVSRIRRLSFFSAGVKIRSAICRRRRNSPQHLSFSSGKRLLRNFLEFPFAFLPIPPFTFGVGGSPLQKF